MSRMRIVALVGGVLVAGSVTSAVSQPAASPDDACVARLRQHAVTAGVSATTIDDALRGFQPDQSVLQARRRQPEFITPIWDYLAFLVDDQRIADGRARLTEWATTLDLVEQRFGVDRHTVVAVWAIESDFGRILGQRPVVRSLATEACYGQRRPQAMDQWVASLRIVASGELSGPLIGSWAGAFGQTQFMPTTYLATAVDQDGDGRRDIMGSVPDALGSTANFLAKAGWTTGEPWGYEVKLTRPYRGRAGRTFRQKIGVWSKLGVRRPDGGALAGAGSAALVLPTGRRGPAFLVLRNYDAIYSYNAAQSYALAIGHLADRLRGGSPLVQPWPTTDRGLSRVERREVQEHLGALGHEVGPIDGALGSITRAAIKEFQAAVGLPADGRAGGRVLDSLRARAAGRPRPPA